MLKDTTKQSFHYLTVMLMRRVFQDARTIVKKDQPNVFKDTKIIKLTEPIPNDTISVRPDMDKAFQDKLKSI